MTAAAQPRRATVIDDDRWLLELVGEMLSEHGWQVSTLSGCRDLQPILETKPDLLIVDKWLGSDSLNGDQIAALVRSHGELANLPIVLCSGEVDGVVNYESDLFTEPGTYPLPKPFSMGDLQSAVEQALLERAAALSAVA